MKRFFLLVGISAIITLSGCGDKQDVNHYYSPSERDTLLTDIITYIYIMPKYSDWQTRFEPRFRKYYAQQVDKFRFEKYFIDNKGIHYYYLIRPARSVEGNVRGVGGTFRLDENGKITSFTEIFNTPVGSIQELQQRGEELFKRMVRHGNIDDYLTHPDYIEWPDKITYYDTIQHEWLVKPGI